MARRAMLIAVALGLVGACGGLPPAEHVCDEAQYSFLACGVRVPLLNDGACSGLRLSAAECVMDHADTCEDLVELVKAPDSCLTELFDPPFTEAPGDDLFPDDPEAKE